MENNKITLKQEDGKTMIYNILFEVTMEGYNYVAYTNNKIDKTNSTVVYFGKYLESDNILKNINKKEEEKLKLILSKFRSKDGN